MNRTLWSAGLSGLLVVLLVAASCRQEPAGAPGGRPLGATPTDGRTSDGRPLAFEANQGQTDSRVRFLQRGRNHALFLAPDEAVLELRRAEGRADVLRMRLLGSNVRLDPVGLDALPGRSNYLIGNDPRGWRTGIPRYGRVKYENVYPGVDLIFHGRDGRLEYDLAVAPGVDPAIIRLGFQGAGRLRIDDRGNLILPFGRGEVVQRAPFLYQDVGGVRSVIPGKYLLKGRAEVGFAVDRAAYDPERPLVIDPILGYSTYLGGSALDAGEAVAVDASGSAYVVGTTFSPNFPLANPRQSAMSGSGDVFVAKLDPSGGGLVYSTYLGGGNSDYGSGIAVDGAGNAYVTGQTYSTDFPMAGAFQKVKGGSTSSTDAFVTKLTPDGSALAYSSYLGGSEADGGGGVAVDAAGRVSVVGATSSDDFPIAKAFQTCRKGGLLIADAFVATIAADGSSLAYSTYIGGSSSDGATGVAVDPAGNVYVTGVTQSSDFPAINPLSVTPAHRPPDVFVLKLDTTRMSFVYSTVLGGSFDDYGAGIAADAAGNAYVTGTTNSGDFPLKNPAQPTRTDWDAFVTKIDPMGSSLVYSTYLGGSRYDAARAIAVDAAGQAHVIGATMSADFPVVRPVRRFFGGGGWDAFVTKLSSDGGSFVYSTFLGGSGYDDGGGIAVDGGGDATVTGRTGSYDFPTVGAVQWSFAGGEEDAFVTKIVEDGPRPEPTPAPSPAASGGRFEQDDDRIAYSGGWYSNTTCGHSHGSAALSAEPGGSVTVPFDGTGIRWIGYRDEWSGTASVYLDGNFIETVDTYASPARFQAVLFSIEGLSPGTHTLGIHVDGSHGPDSAGSWVWVDALDVVGGPLGPSPEPSPTPTPTPTPAPTPTPTPTPPPVAGRTEESNLAAVSYGGAWYTHLGIEHSGGTAVLSMEPGARAAFTFSGTGVRWVGLRDEWSGIASVFLDGVFIEAVDSYASPEQFQAVLFSAEGLSPGTHTLVIEVTGSSGAASNGAWVWVDAFDVSDDPMASSGFP